VLTGPQVILVLKVAVLAVTLLFLSSLVAIVRGKVRLHGRVNLVFFILTVVALIGLEVSARFLDPELFAYFDQDAQLKRALSIHLSFSLPSAFLMPLMLYTGLTRRRRIHLSLAVLFSILWTGTFITGIFYLPHAP
jgi:uncharacterized membrane protein YozB (DUF420 family)